MNTDKGIARLYSTAQWRRLRKHTLTKHPVCVMCRRRVATIADHIKPHRGDVILFRDKDNLQGLCKRCHDSDKALIDNGKEPKKEIGVDGWTV